VRDNQRPEGFFAPTGPEIWNDWKKPGGVFLPKFYWQFSRNFLSFLALEFRKNLLW
jgi:hypothetical protein